MPIEHVPYVEPLSHPLVAAWRGYFQGIWYAVKGWKETETLRQPNPFSGVLLAAHSVTAQTTTPAGLSPALNDVVLLQPDWGGGTAQTVLFSAQVLTAGQLRWQAYNYGAGSILMGVNDVDFRVILFHQ